jgi:cardiolipin synthase
MNTISKLDFVSNNQLLLLQGGLEYFSALIEAIGHASQEIILETYIFSNDDAANSIKHALCEAAKRGVQVHVIVDWIGSGSAYSANLKKEFQEAGVECRIFNPWFRRGLARTHRKLAIIDQQLAFVGGINLIDDFLSDNVNGLRLAFPRWDFAVQVKGPLLKKINLEMQAQWLKLGKLEILQRLNIAQNLRLLRFKKMPQDEHISQAVFIVRDNLRNRNKIRRAYLHALDNAKNRVILANPYFAPGRNIRNALISAAKRGVDVTLLLGVGAFRLQDAVAHSFYPTLLASGVKIIEYRKTELHAKVAVIDDDWATVGSSNIDGLSLFLNHEANLVIKDHNFTYDLTCHLEKAISEGVQIDVLAYQKKAWLHRVWYRFAYIIYKGIMRLATLGKYR